jgi:chemotaxis signal transduction protein
MHQLGLSKMSLPEQTTANKAGYQDEAQLRDLFLFIAGGRTFAVFSEEVDGTAEVKKPTRLPRAPASILGVVYARGRMLTLVDPTAVTSGEPLTWPTLIPAVISLRGDEQLALAAESLGEAITVSSSDIAYADGVPERENSQAVAGILRHGGEKITILDPGKLFNVAVQRKDRRRRRF